MGKLFFSANGRITSQEFTKGAVILLALNFVLWLAWYGSFGFALVAGVISIATIFCWACLFSKRFHDADRTGWMFVLALLAFLGLALFLVPMILSPLMPVDAEILAKAQELLEMQEEIKTSPPQTMEELAPMFELTKDIYQANALKSAITFFVSGAIVAFGTNALLKTDPEANRWG